MSQYCDYLRRTAANHISSSHGYSDVEVGPSPSEISVQSAFRIFPIAHQYELKTILNICIKTVAKSKLDLWPSERIALSEVPRHPGLVQWLALTDAKKCDALVDSCLAQLTARSDDTKGMPVLREALASPSLSPMLEGLRLETLIKAMRLMVGLSLLKVMHGSPF